MRVKSKRGRLNDVHEKLHVPSPVHGWLVVYKIFQAVLQSEHVFRGSHVRTGESREEGRNKSVCFVLTCYRPCLQITRIVSVFTENTTFFFSWLFSRDFIGGPMIQCTRPVNPIPPLWCESERFTQRARQLGIFVEATTVSDQLFLCWKRNKPQLPNVFLHNDADIETFNGPIGVFPPLVSSSGL